MDQLDRRADPKRAAFGDAEQSRPGDDEKGTDALSAAQGCITHGLHQTRLGAVVQGQQAIKHFVDGLGGLGQRLLESGHRRLLQSTSSGSTSVAPSGPRTIFSTRTCASCNLASQ